MRILGTRIAEARKLNDLTQRDLAEALGVSVQAVSQWENGKTDASARLMSLAHALRVDPVFLTGENKSTDFSSDVQGSPQDRIPVIKLQYLPAYVASFSREKMPNVDLYISSTVNPQGQLFAIEVTIDSEKFQKGDLLIFDNMVIAESNDIVVMLALGNNEYSRIAKNEDGTLFLDGASGVICELSGGRGEEFPLVPISVQYDESGRSVSRAIVLVATLVERRTFRRRP